MLVIRKEQMEALARGRRETFEARMVRDVGDALVRRAGRGARTPARVLVQHGIARAAGHGLEDASDVAAFLELMAAAGLSFDEEPWASRILRDGGASARVRMQALRARFAARARG